MEERANSQHSKALPTLTADDEQRNEGTAEQSIANEERANRPTTLLNARPRCMSVISQQLATAARTTFGRSVVRSVIIHSVIRHSALSPTAVLRSRPSVTRSYFSHRSPITNADRPTDVWMFGSFVVCLSLHSLVFDHESDDATCHCADGRLSVCLSACLPDCLTVSVRLSLRSSPCSAR